MNEPCDFVKLVLQRMDSNPEEFEHYGRWNSLCEALERYAGAYTGNRPVPDRNVMWAYDQFEVDLMVAKYREIYRDREYKSMLKSILAGQEPKSGWGNTISGSQYTTTPGTALSGGVISNSVLQQTATAQLNASFAEAYRNATGMNTVNSNPQLRSQIEDALEARMQGFKRG
jgi:hypothetical protein